MNAVLYLDFLFWVLKWYHICFGYVEMKSAFYAPRIRFFFYEKGLSEAVVDRND